MDTADADTLRSAVLEVSADPAMAARVAGLQEEMLRAGGTTTAADLIESCLT